MKRLIKFIGLFLLFVASFLVLNACGGTGSGASSPVTPAQVPSSIEYASGDAIIVGGFGGGGLSNLAAKGTSASGVPDAVYAITAGGTFETATLDDECFYLPVPAGSTYALVFSYSDGVKYFASSTLGINSIPLNLVTGASSSGTANFTDCALSASTDISKASSGSVNTVEIGTATPSTSTVSASVADASFLSQTGMTSSNSRLLGQYDGPLTRFANSTYISQMDADLTALHKINGASTADDVINAYVDPDLLSYEGYSYQYQPKNGIRAATATLTLPFNVTDSNGATFSAGTAVRSCSTTDVRYVFFCGEVTSGLVSTPASPEAGAFTVQEAGLSSLSINVPLAQVHDNIESLTGIAMPFVSLTKEGDYITGLSWKWMIKESGTWRLMTYDEMRLLIMAHSEGRTTGHVIVDIHYGSSDYQRLGVTSTSYSGTETLTTPIAYSSYTRVTMDYHDTAGYQYYVVYSNH